MKRLTVNVQVAAALAICLALSTAGQATAETDVPFGAEDFIVAIADVVRGPANDVGQVLTRWGYRLLPGNRSTCVYESETAAAKRVIKISTNNMDCTAADAMVRRIDARETLKAKQFDVQSEMSALGAQLQVEASCPLTSGSIRCTWTYPPTLPKVRQLTINLNSRDIPTNPSYRQFWFDPTTELDDRMKAQQQNPSFDPLAAWAEQQQSTQRSNPATAAPPGAQVQTTPPTSTPAPAAAGLTGSAAPVTFAPVDVEPTLMNQQFLFLIGYRDGVLELTNDQLTKTTEKIITADQRVYGMKNRQMQELVSPNPAAETNPFVLMRTCPSNPNWIAGQTWVQLSDAPSKGATGNLLVNYLLEPSWAQRIYAGIEPCQERWKSLMAQANRPGQEPPNVRVIFTMFTEEEVAGRNPAFAAQQYTGRVKETIDLGVEYLPAVFVESNSNNVQSATYDFNTESVVLQTSRGYDYPALITPARFYDETKSMVGEAAVRADPRIGPMVKGRYLHGSAAHGYLVGKQTGWTERVDDPLYLPDGEFTAVSQWQVGVHQGLNHDGTYANLRIIWALDRSMEIQTFKMSFAEAEKRFGSSSQVGPIRSRVEIRNVRALGLVESTDHYGKPLRSIVLTGEVQEAILMAGNEKFASGGNLFAGMAATAEIVAQQQATEQAEARQAKAEAEAAEQAEQQAVAEALAGIDACLTRTSAGERFDCVEQICTDDLDLGPEVDRKCRETRRLARVPKLDEVTADLDECLAISDRNDRDGCIKTACRFDGQLDEAMNQCDLARDASSQMAMAKPAVFNEQDMVTLKTDLDTCLQGDSPMQRMQCVQTRCGQLSNQGVTSKDAYLECSLAQQKAFTQQYGGQ